MGTTLVVGASLAGIHAARTLRLGGHDGPIVVVDADPDAPYDKPPLSKQILAGSLEPDRIVLPAIGEGLDLDLRLGLRAVSLDLGERVVGFDDGRGPVAHAFDQLVIATGASARRLPGTEHIKGVHVLRTLHDALALRAELDAGPSRVVVIGAGFIGAEVAATCRGRGLDVTVVEALDVPLERILGVEMGRVCARVHEQNGVDLRLGCGVERIDTVEVEGAARVVGVTLTDGSSIPAEVVVVGIGVRLNVDWLEGSGLDVDDGVVCDASLRAAPGVVAAGDLARYPSARFGRPLRIEHWETAIQSGESAARTLLADRAGETAPVHDPVPWFWSDQYDRKIQLAGRPSPDDECVVVHGSTDDLRFVALYGNGDTLTGVLGMNRPRHVVQLRMAMEEGVSFSEARERASA